MLDIKKKLGPVYRQSGKNQKGWTDTSVYPGRTEPYLSDDELKELNSIATPIREYILNVYPVEEAFDALNPINKQKVLDTERILLLGSKSISLAIWLSQWGYDTHVALADIGSANKAKNDARRQAGLFNGMYVLDYTNDCPRARAIVVLDLVETFDDDRVLGDWIHLLLSRAEVVLAYGDWNKDWRKILNEYKVSYIDENNGYKYFTVKRK